MSCRRVSILAAGALALALAAGGCGNETVDKVTGMADQACACREAACADKVEKDFWDFVKAGQKQGSQSDRDEVQAQYKRMRECLTRVRSAADVTTPAEAVAPETGGQKGAGQ